MITNIEIYLKILVLVLVILFFVFRSRFLKHYKKFSSRTLVKYFIMLFLFYFYIFGYFDFAQLNLNIYFRLIAGIIIIFLGVSLLFWAHSHLNINWSPIIEKKFSKSRSLVKSGPYKYIRHPIYTASFIAVIGFFILSANWLLAGIPLVILILFYISKIPREENELIRNFGKKYKDYMKTTGGLLPK
ncbi:MAG: isoprenylcysteine carboxylmethyltransferase family protein [Candidatus Pacearchaeota archaeon]